MSPMRGVETHAVDDLLGVEAFHLGVGVELVEVADAKSEVSIGEKFHGLGFGGAHEEGIDVGFERALLKEGCKGAARLRRGGHRLRASTMMREG